MEVHLSPEKEARLQQLATRTGRDAAQVVQAAVDRILEYEESFLAAVEKAAHLPAVATYWNMTRWCSVSSRSSTRDPGPLDYRRRC